MTCQQYVRLALLSVVYKYTSYDSYPDNMSVCIDVWSVRSLFSDLNNNQCTSQSRGLTDHVKSLENYLNEKVVEKCVDEMKTKNM